MPLSIYNTLTSKKEEFKPQIPGKATMYVCGVTPYDEVHLGHARAYVTFDIVRRHLEASGYAVTYIQNFTDVDDKIIKRAAERGIAPRALAQTYIDDYFTQMDLLNIKRADSYPRVTETIPKIIAFIETLVENGSAYATTAGDVFFSVGRFPGYGKLSKRNIDELKSGARVDVNETKNDPLDFALWKAAKAHEPAEVTWDSPWGKGRPGWHIECSVMSTSALGVTLDIHGGGQDLIFPHHENEIAQSEAATGTKFVNYWIHNGFVTVNAEKMSKSLGNFFTLKDIFKKFSPRAVRYFLLSQHYRSPLDFSDTNLQQAQNALEGLDEVLQKLAAAGDAAAVQPDADAVAAAQEAMDDDFNTEKLLAVAHGVKKDGLAALAANDPAAARCAYRTLELLLSGRLGITLPQAEEIPSDVLRLRDERGEARKNKDWKRSDEIRAELDSRGYRIQDKPDGTAILIRKSS